MDRIARLINSSVALRRQIWASLPFSFRVAEFFSRLAVSTNEAFGKAIYGEFLAHGIVEGMPPIHGNPASEFDVSRKPVANRLPSGYGLEFGKKVFMVLMSKLHNPEFAEEIMSDFLVRFLGGGSKALASEKHRHEAEKYVLMGIQREMMNAIRHKRRKDREISDIYMSPGGEEQRREVPVFDEDTAERQFKRLLPKVKHSLDRIHPDAALYLKLSIIDGYSDRDIIGDVAHGVPSLLPNPHTKKGLPLSERYWAVSYKPAIYELLKEKFSEAQSLV